MISFKDASELNLFLLENISNKEIKHLLQNKELLDNEIITFKEIKNLCIQNLFLDKLKDYLGVIHPDIFYFDQNKMLFIQYNNIEFKDIYDEFRLKVKNNKLEACECYNIKSFNINDNIIYPLVISSKDGPFNLLATSIFNQNIKGDVFYMKYENIRKKCFNKFYF